ncbi:testis specific protein Y-linked isoform X1 [Osmerus mordax]|uniref:testis specific protein Y-linked isoform X1 n=1 Tax=Osmerus mordax TaxID=8014 RepID=UPI00350ECD57
MSESSDCKQSVDSAPRKRCPSPEQCRESPAPSKLTKLDETSCEVRVNNQGNNKQQDNGTVSADLEKQNGKEESGLSLLTGQGEERSAAVNVSNPVGANIPEKTHESGDAKVDAKDCTVADCRPSTSLDQSDSAAIAAAEALASLTGGDGDLKRKETPCSSKRVDVEKQGNKIKRSDRDSSKGSSKLGRSFQTQAAAADSSTSAHVDREVTEDMPDADEEDDSIPESSSTPSSSFPSDNEDNDDGECAIVSVKMAPEIRQSVSLLAQVQMRLDALEKKSARLHQRLELKMSRQRRPHLDQRSAIAKSIPGFWVTALLNHPHLSAHIDETDEDALSYMTDLEIESFKNNKLGYRIGFHFRRNPYFQNNIIVKELHLGMGGSPVSFSNPILWHRGQNLTANSEPRRLARGVYQTFFCWFSDHSSPGRDDIAQILKEDLYRNPLRYYLTPLWEPRENGSGASGTRAADNSNGDECVVISDSDDDQEESGRGQSREEEEEEDEEEEEEEQRGSAGDESPVEVDDGEVVIDGSDSDEEAREEEESYGEKDEEVDVEDVDEFSRGQEARDQEEEDIDVDEDEDQS